jgi:hypothetical protein
MKTLPELVKAHIDRKASLAFDNEGIMREAREAEARMKARLASDPSLRIFVSYYADGVLGALPMIPDGLRPMIMRDLLAQIITEWEDINIEFNKSLQ